MQQYLDMIDFALPDIKDILYLKRLVAGNLDELFRMYTSNENKDASFKDAMKHVMWHTIDDFITDLINKMKCIEGITFNIPVSNGEYQINKTDLHQKSLEWLTFIQVKQMFSLIIKVNLTIYALVVRA